MINYDPKHPKGTKYTASELKAHRENWYQRVSSASIPAEQSKPTQSDHEVYNWIVNTLHWDEGVRFLKEHDFGNVFRCEWLEALQKIWSQRDNPLKQFTDPILEALRAEMVHTIDSFLAAIAEYTDISPKNETLVRIPREWHGDGPSHNRTWFEAARRTLNNAAEDVFNAYSRLVGEARRRLS